MDKITSIVLAFTLATSLIFYTLWRVEKSKYEAIAKQLIQLESTYTIDYTKLKPIIRYKDKKIEIIKSVPVYVGKDCEKELQRVKNIIDSF